jgi:hypothetical protein
VTKGNVEELLSDSVGRMIEEDEELIHPAGAEPKPAVKG